MKEKRYPKKELGEYLKSIRKNKKITARVLGEKMGYSQSHISGVENGQKSIPDNNFLENYLSSISDTNEEYNFYVREIKKLTQNEIELNEVTVKNNSFYSSLKRATIPYEFNFINFKNKPEKALYDVPINDFHFHLKDMQNLKFYKNIELSEVDKKNILLLLDSYFEQKINIQQEIKNQIVHNTLKLEELNKLIKDIEDKL